MVRLGWGEEFNKLLNRSAVVITVFRYSNLNYQVNAKFFPKVGELSIQYQN